MNRLSQFASSLAVRVFVISILAVSFMISGCGSPAVIPAPIGITLSPSAAPSVDQGKSVTVTASLTNDVKGLGVTWALVGPGTMVTTSTTATYTAPTTVTASTAATLTATSVADTTKSSLPLSIVLVVPPTITTLSSSFAQGTVGLPFTGTVTETGGVAPYSWSITSGPTWLTAAASTTSTVTISGTPTVAGNPVPITVKVTDAQGLTNSVTLNLIINAPIANACTGTPSGNESLLAANSSYAVFLQGFHGPGAGSPVALAASISTDGAGHITGGEEDVNGASGPQHLTIIPGSSSYSIGPDNRGCLSLAFSGAPVTTAAYHFAVGGVTAGVASRGRIIEFDDNSGTDAGTRGSGIIRLQDKTSFALTALNPRYAFGMDGFDSVGAHVAMGGAFSVNTSGAISAGFLDVDDGGALQSAVTGATGAIATTATTATTGRETATLAWTSGGSHSMTDAIYMVNANEFFIIETDTLAVGKPIIAGRAIVTGSTFSAASLSGNYLIHTSGSSVGAANITLGILTIGSSAVNGTLMNYSAAGGLVSSPIAGGTYTFDATNSGRAVLTGTGSNPPVLYRAAPAANTETLSVFLIGTDTSATFGFAEVQPAATYSASSLAGNFVLGTEDPSDNTTNAVVGAVTVLAVPAPGTYSATQDVNDTGGILQVGSVDAETITVTANGTVTFVGNSKFAVTNGTKIFVVQAEPGSAAFIVVIEQ